MGFLFGGRSLIGFRFTSFYGNDRGKFSQMNHRDVNKSFSRGFMFLTASAAGGHELPLEESPC